MGQLVARYRDPKYDVRHWELGNEVDVDPSLVAPNNGFGCWGDIKDPYYGGRHYGEMLKVVAPAIRAANPAAKIWFGGLLLDLPNTASLGAGAPSYSCRARCWPAPRRTSTFCRTTPTRPT